MLIQRYFSIQNIQDVILYMDVDSSEDDERYQADSIDSELQDYINDTNSSASEQEEEDEEDEEEREEALNCRGNIDDGIDVFIRAFSAY